MRHAEARAGVLLLVSSLASPLAAQVTLLDPTPGAGAASAIAIGSDGLGLIAYYNQLDTSLRVAHCSNAACDSATLTTLDPQGNDTLSLTIGSDGLGLILYLGAAGVKIAHCLDLACTAAPR